MAQLTIPLDADLSGLSKRLRLGKVLRCPVGPGGDWLRQLLRKDGRKASLSYLEAFQTRVLK
ncbi:MAG: hypothetical protein ACI9R3_004968 [Verrucomicrobiales bacterium]|jgi:hypothetical protein